MSAPISDRVSPRWRRLLALVGYAQLASDLGVSERTLRRWATGESKMRGPNQMALAVVCQNYKVPCP